MKKCIITVGCSGSGKSTFARQLQEENYVRLERDQIRLEILKGKNIEEFEEGNKNMWSYWNFKWEDQVTRIINELKQDAIDNELNVIISDTNLNKERRDNLVKEFESQGYEVEVIVFGKDMSMDELWKRDLNRLHSVGHSVIAKQYQEFRKEYPKYQLQDAHDSSRCVIFDVDGTLTLGPYNRSPYEWDKVSQDLPRINLFHTLLALNNEGYKIVVMSGRDSVCREDTLKWLERWYSYVEGISHNFTEYPQFELYMRPEGDMRSDIEIKKELFFNHIDGKYNVVAVYDDRAKVVRNVWLEFGFDVYCVGNQYLEF